MIRDVRLTENDTETTPVNTPAEWAGYLGVAPLVLCLAAGAGWAADLLR